MDADPGTVGCWKPGRAYGAGGAIQAGNSPFTDADFLAYNAISGNEFVDHFNTLDSSWVDQRASHGDWGVTGGFLEHDGADSGNGNDPNKPRIMSRSALDPTPAHTVAHLSMHYEVQVVRGGGTGDTVALRMESRYPATVSIECHYDDDEYNWIFDDGLSLETGSGGDPEETQQVMHIHIRRRDDPASNEEYLAGIFIGTLSAGVVTASYLAHSLAPFRDIEEGRRHWGVLLENDRDGAAGNAEETGDYLYVKAHSKER